jgi:hypothetical protein
MDCAGCSEFTINFRIAARETFIARIDIVLHTDISSFPVRVIYAVSQIVLRFIQFFTPEKNEKSKIILNHVIFNQLNNPHSKVGFRTSTQPTISQLFGADRDPAETQRKRLTSQKIKKS